MDKKEFKQIIKECIEEILIEGVSKPKPLKPTKIRKTWGDMNPITRIHGDGKQEHKPKYDRKKDQGWKKDVDENESKEKKVNEMTTTGAVQGFMGKNWVDPDPQRKRIKSIAAKSVGGKVA